MSRAGIAVVVGVAVVLAGCGGGGSASSDSPTCSLLADLARTGQTVQRADVSDPDAFATTMHDAVTKYVETATKLRAAMPAHLQGDVQRMIAAARTERFADAVDARSKVDRYARANCKTST